MAGGKGKNRNTGAAASQGSHFFEEVMAFLLLTVTFVGMLWQGLLFERDNIPVVVVLSVLAAAVLLKTRVAGEWKIRRLYTVGLFLLLTLASAVALLRAVYPHNAVYAMSKYCSVFLLVLAVQALDEKIPFVQWLAKALVAAGFAYALLGLDAVWGGRLVEAINTALNGGPLAEGEQGFLFDMIMGDRLRSVFQYPNTMASFFVAAWFAAAHQFVRDGAYWKPGKWRRAGIAFTVGAANLIFAAFVLTVSRGMYLIAAVMLPLYVLFMPSGRRGRPLARYLLCFVPGLLLGALSLPGTPLWDLTAGPGWLLILALFALSGFAADVAVRMQRAQRQALPSDAADVKAKRPRGAQPDDAPGVKRTRRGDDAPAAKRTPQRSGTPAPSASTGRLKPKIILIAIAALCACTLLAAVFIWQYSRPFPMGSGQTIVRQFRTDKTGGYALTLQFDRPIDDSAADTQIRLEGQNRQEMLQRYYTPYLSIDLSAFIGRQEISLPFTAPDQEMYFRLSISDRGTAAGNAVTSAYVAPAAAPGAAPAPAAGASAAAAGSAKGIKLNRFLLTESMVRGIETAIHPQTMYERFGFYLDGFRMFLDYPLTGIGGDSWRYLYTSYQKHPYVANDLHSHAMQLIVEYGVIGLLVFLGFLAAFIALLIRCLKLKDERDVLLLMIAGGLFAHSMIDVDFTFYGQYLIFAFAFALIGLPALNPFRSASAGSNDVDRTSAGRTSAGSTGAGNKDAGSKDAGRTGANRISADSADAAPPQLPPWARWGRDAAVVIALVLACLWPVRFGRANSYTAAYFYCVSTDDLDSATWLIGQAVKWDPLKPEYKAAEAIALGVNQYTAETFSRAQGLAAEAGKQGRFSGDTQGMLLSYYYRTRQYEEAWTAGLRAAEAEPYRGEYWLALGKLIDDIWFNYSIADVINDSGDVVEEDRDNEAIRYWLEKGVGITAEMTRVSAGRWVPAEPEDELAGLIASWYEALTLLK